MTTFLANAVVHELTESGFGDVIPDRLTVVEFWAASCGPCRTMAPQLERAAGLRPRCRFAKVSVDEQPRLAARFGVRSIPTLDVIGDGRVL